MGGQNPAAIPATLVTAQAASGQSYSKTFFLQQVQEINAKYPGLGETQNAPSNNFIYWYGMGLHWPKSNPITPAGNPVQRGIVAGVIYDPNTPYAWTQEMKAQFPMATLISSQGEGHGLEATSKQGSDAYPCTHLTERYFTTGEVGAVDGTTCRAPLPSFAF
jgi:hypothetical protein